MRYQEFTAKLLSRYDMLYTATIPKYKVGDHLLVKLSGGRIVGATIKAVVETTEGVRLQVSFGNETALIYPWQMVPSDAYCKAGLALKYK
jgi:hypothetical protein